jgi:hypothetical protein
VWIGGRRVKAGPLRALGPTLLQIALQKHVQQLGLSEREIPGDVALLRVERARDVAEAVTMVDTDDPLVYIMPEGYSTLPIGGPE